MSLLIFQNRWMKIVLYFALTLVVILIVLAVLVAFRPNKFQVSRSATIHAPPEAVFPHINRLSAWGEWSPFEKVDPDMEKTFEGPESGEGAVLHWKGNSQAGAGSSTIVKSVPNESIQIDLRMIKPFGCHNDVWFTFQPIDEGTVVTWRMSGDVGYFGKILHLIISMDNMVGGQFEKGLADLKTIVEANEA